MTVTKAVRVAMSQAYQFEELSVVNLILLVQENNHSGHADLDDSEKTCSRATHVAGEPLQLHGVRNRDGRLE